VCWKERKRAGLHQKNRRGKKRKEEKEKKNKEIENWTTFENWKFSGEKSEKNTSKTVLKN
jgi:hypothetical protein